MRDSWEIEELGEVCEILDNKRKPITKRNRIEGEIPYYGATGILSYVKNYIFNERLILLGEDGAKWESGDNSAFLIEGKTWVNNHAHVIKPNRDILSDYWLIYNLNFQNLLPFVSGMTVPKLNQGNMKKIPIPIPPLPEQKRIVSILDRAFEAIDKAKANAEQNLINAKELFESYLQGVFENKGDDWEEKTILELCEHKSQIVGGPFGSNLKVSDYKESGIPILRLQNIGKGYFIDKDIKYVSKEKAEELAYHSFESGDIILAKLGIPIGKTCIVPEDFEYGIVVADVVRIRPNKETINYDFLKYFLNSDNAVNQLSKDITGATRPRVNIAEVRNLKLSVPSFSEQVAITKHINTLENLKNKQIEIYTSKLNSLNELKKSILQKAFAGEFSTKEIAL